MKPADVEQPLSSSSASSASADPALRLACEGAGLGIWDWDLRAETLVYSQTAKAICGFPPDAAVTLDMARAVTHPDDLPATTALSQRALDPAIRANEPYEYRIVRPDGVQRWVLAYGSTVFEEAGGGARAVRYVGTIQDITERKLATESLQASERRLRMALDAARSAVWAWDAATGEVTSSVELNRVLGFPDDHQSTAEERSGLYMPGEQERVRAQGAAALAQGRTEFDVEYQFRRPDGQTRWALLRAQFGLAQDGAPASALGVLLDITARKEAEIALQQSEARLRDLNEDLERSVAERTSERDLMWRLSQDLLIVIDQDGTVRAVNPAARALGYLPQDVVGRHVGEFIHPDDVAKAAEALLAAQTGPISDVAIRLTAVDGGVREFCWSASSVDGAVYAMGRDITEESARHAALRQAQEALRQSQKMEAMGQLTGGVAHDFNNLLMPIMGSLDILRRGIAAGTREERLVEGAMQAAARAKTLVQRLLAFARRQPLRTAAVDLAALVSNMEDLIASTCGAHSRLEVHVAPETPPVQADANQLEMALLNLAVNARDAMPEGGRLSIAADPEEVGPGHRTGLPSGPFVRLRVADTGLGMDADTLARAVEPFFSTKGVGQGTGLGLSMVHGLAAQLGGALLIESELGAGTAVELWLPVAAGAAVPVSAERGGTTEAVRAGAALLVDDEPLVREATAQMLADLGYQVHEAAGADEALALLERLPGLDVLVTDHMMPGLSGAELARRVRAQRPSLPVLIVTGYAKADAVVCDFPRLGKPFMQEELAASLQAVRAAFRSRGKRA